VKVKGEAARIQAARAVVAALPVPSLDLGISQNIRHADHKQWIDACHRADVYSVWSGQPKVNI
jgi:hypothetical protein